MRRRKGHPVRTGRVPVKTGEGLPGSHSSLRESWSRSSACGGHPYTFIFSGHPFAWVQ